MVKATWFAGRLRELRESVGLTQSQLAEKARMTREGVAQLETGRRKPAWETVLALCGALNVSCESFTQPPKEQLARSAGRPARSKPSAEAPMTNNSGRSKGKRRS